MSRLSMLVLSLLAVVTASPWQSVESKQVVKRQLPQCAGYGSVCRLDFTNQVNVTKDEFYTEDGDFCTCPVGTVSLPEPYSLLDFELTHGDQCSTVFIDDGNEKFDSYTKHSMLS
ncbi:hypothetical protein UA08_09420 [Talaromyces atroroseus]|uniref:Uncharacterized protein n=1 Tax=Talaromyces atroroseus TaxID=1441469 RepID=A0A1Q5Q664_TALAT|nr:hypothetical protein UA08_09420 [Talaromyces atroroseus]OKL55358.1 hypothetical protein UA08_09420 [Talaromyces atroroseus]